MNWFKLVFNPRRPACEAPLPRDWADLPPYHPPSAGPGGPVPGKAGPQPTDCCRPNTSE